MIGIYKITSPTKRVYIGQSIDIMQRKSFYERLDCKGQPKLFRSLKKYGFKKHKFEIVTECDAEGLNKWERYYQDLFSACGANGLNCTLTGYNDRSGKLSEETKAKMSASSPRRKLLPDQMAKMLEGRRNMVLTPELSAIFSRGQTGRKHSDETKAKISQALRMQVTSEKTREIRRINSTGRIKSPEEIKKISDAAKGNKRTLGYKHTDEYRKNCSDRMKGQTHSRGVKFSEEAVRGVRERAQAFGKPVTCIETNITYTSLGECARQMGLHSSNIAKYIKTKKYKCKGYTFKLA